MKKRQVWLLAAISLLMAISLIGCSPTESQKLQEELDGIHAQIRLANQKNAEVKEKYLRDKQK